MDGNSSISPDNINPEIIEEEEEDDDDYAQLPSDIYSLPTAPHSDADYRGSYIEIDAPSISVSAVPPPLPPRDGAGFDSTA